MTLHFTEYILWIKHKTLIKYQHILHVESTYYYILFSNQFKSATLLSATHECTPKIWANHERHSFQNWRVKIERHSFLGVSEVKECTLSKSLRIYEILTQILIFFALRSKWNVFNILLLLIIASSVFVQQILIHNRQFKHHIQCTLSLCFTFF